MPQTTPGYLAYQTYLAVKFHYTMESYDYHKYHGKVRSTFTKFLTRRDRWHFEKLAKKYKDRDLLDFFVANFTEDQTLWVGDALSPTAENVYLQWRKRVESLEYQFKNDVDRLLQWVESGGKGFSDLFIVSESGYAPICLLFLQGKISRETMCILHKIFGFVPRVSKETKSPVWTQEGKCIMKYVSFLTIDVPKYKRILREKIAVNGVKA